MVRKQVYIGVEHEAALKRQARELGLTESELIRRGIEQVGRAPVDERALRDFLTFARDRAERLRGAACIHPLTPANRGWTRDELYDRRPPFGSR